MTAASQDPKKAALLALREEIRSHQDWWFFPDQDPVQGFMGTDNIFIVGDQPSTSAWGAGNKHRTLFYGTLQSVGLANAHLTDLYKKRGLSSALRNGLPADFPDHVRLFRKEIEILQPKQIVALGELAQWLLNQKLPDLKQPIPRIWHFSYVAQAKREKEYAAHISDMIWGH